MIRLEPEIALAPSPLDEGLDRPQPLASTADADADRRIERTIAYMKEHLHQPLQAAALASRANVSLSHYFALFKRLTGCTPIDYFIHLRMERAREMLESTALTVKEVAAALGYDDPFYFSRVFKSTSGLAPTDYRYAQRKSAVLIPLANGTMLSRNQLAAAALA
jgi:transcriptional regulator GlxA family with amidase domain